MPPLPFPVTEGPAQITLVTSTGCHFCRDAEEALDELAAEYPLVITSLDLRSPQGGALAQRHRAAMSPLVLLDGVFVSSGRLPRGKLRALLSARARETEPVS
jgi:glutaredoxin